MVSSAVDFVPVPEVREINQQFIARGAAEARCVITCLFVVLELGCHHHVTFGDGLEARLTGLEKKTDINSLGKLEDKVSARITSLITRTQCAYHFIYHIARRAMWRILSDEYFGAHFRR